MGIITPEEDASSEDNLKTELEPPPAPKVRPDLPTPVAETLSSAEAEHRDASSELNEETQKFIAQSLTDVDLFASYGLTQKAIGLLEAILRRAPRHTPTLEKLLDFVLGAGDDRRTAELASRLEKLHAERGDNRSAERFAELRRRFQRAAGVTDAELTAASAAALSGSSHSSANADETLDEEEISAIEIAPEPISAEPAVAEFAVPGSTKEEHAAPEPVASNAAQDVHEVDLSDEWLSVLKEVEPVETNPETSAPAVEPPRKNPYRNSLSPIRLRLRKAQLRLKFPRSQRPLKKRPTLQNLQPPNQRTIRHSFRHLTCRHLLNFRCPHRSRLQHSKSPHIRKRSTPPLNRNDLRLIFLRMRRKPRRRRKLFLQELPALEEIDVSAFSVEPMPTSELESQAVKPAAEELPELAPVEHSHAPQKIEPPAKEPTKEPEFELDQDYELILDPEPLVPAHEGFTIWKPTDAPAKSITPSLSPRCKIPRLLRMATNSLRTASSPISPAKSSTLAWAN